MNNKTVALASALCQIENALDDLARLKADDDCLGKDMLSLASWLASGAIASVAIAIGEGGKDDPVFMTFVIVSRAQVSLIEAASDERRAWRLRGVDGAIERLTAARADIAKLAEVAS